jgi:PAS domain S-box-containing protein
METALEATIASRFGVLPSFFRLASADPTVAANLWGFAQFAYLDNPMPSLFKERLFVYLSRFCAVRYCIARHVGFLVGLGRPAGDSTCLPQTVKDVLPLLRRSLPRGEELSPFVKACAESLSNGGVFPDPDSAEEQAVFACATHVFLQTPDAMRAQDALAHRLQPRELECLNLFLAFVRMAHFWTKVHPELKFETDITTLLETDEALADCILDDPLAVDDTPRSHVVDELTSFQEMRKVQANLAAIVESSDDAIISKDLSGVIQSWNGGAQRLFGYAAEEVIGKPITIIIPAERLQEEPEILSRLQRGERVDHFETIRKSKSGSLLNISLTVSPVKDATGRVIGASKVARDITERKRQEQELRAANAAVMRSNADLQQFAYSASHDLQEPLRMVATYSELLKEEFGGKLGETGEAYLAHTVRGVERMERLLSDLRAYVHVSASGQEPTEDIDSGAAVDRALTTLEAAIRENEASITRTSLPAVRIYQFELELLFQNLIGNAILYRRSDPPQIDIMARREGTNWLYSVRDNGIGIEPEYQEQVFGMFKRLHNSGEYPGSGMGLAICQRIVERAGGKIWVESDPGRGSTFFFTIPVCEQARSNSAS